MKRRIIFPLFVLMLFLAGCSWSDVVVPTPAFIPSVQVPPTATPFLVTMTPTQVLPTSTSFLPATETPVSDETASATPTLTLTVTATETVIATESLTPTETMTPTETGSPQRDTETPVSPTATSTPPPPSTATSTPLPPSTATSTPLPPSTVTSTPLPPPTATSTPLPPPTATSTPLPPPTATSTLSACLPTYSSGFESEVVALMNEEREKVGLDPLVMQSQLRAAARNHSVDMACHDFVSHTGSDGSSPWARIQAQGYQFSMAAENVAAGQGSPQDVVAAWMASDSHRANILNADYVHVGIGYTYVDGTTFRVYWTADFARP